MADDNSQDWRQGLPEDLRLHPSVLKFKGPDAMAKSYIELESMMGKRVELPDFDKAKPEDLEKFYKHWGRPDKFEEYEFSKVPEGLAIDETFGSSVKSLAHKLGLNKKQFEQLQQWGVEQSQGMLNEQTKEREKMEGSLRSEWGFRYNDNLEKAHKALAMLVGYDDKHPFIKFLETSNMGDHPEFLKFLLDVSEKFNEDKFIDSDVQKEELGKENAKKKINEIRADTKHPYWNENDPRHKDAITEMNKLYEQAYPG